MYVVFSFSKNGFSSEGKKDLNFVKKFCDSHNCFSFYYCYDFLKKKLFFLLTFASPPATIVCFKKIIAKMYILKPLNCVIPNSPKRLFHMT